MSVALNALTPVLAIGGGGTLLRSRPVDSLDACFRNRRSPAIEPLSIPSTVFPYSRPGSTSRGGSSHGVHELMFTLNC